MASADEREVEPLTNYFVGRAQREIRSGAPSALLATAVNRDLLGCRPSRRSSRARPMSAAIDGHYFLDAKRDWVVHGRLAGSQLPGQPRAPSRELQQAPQRYFQRPDATHLEFDPTADDARRLDRQRQPEPATAGSMG